MNTSKLVKRTSQTCASQLKTYSPISPSFWSYSHLSRQWAIFTVSFLICAKYSIWRDGHQKQITCSWVTIKVVGQCRLKLYYYCQLSKSNILKISSYSGVITSAIPQHTFMDLTKHYWNGKENRKLHWREITKKIADFSKNS